MTLFRFEPTEILSRPERKIIWAEVQIRGPSGGVVRKIVESPDAAGPEGICAEILALCYQHYPSMARPDVLAALRSPKPEDDIVHHVRLPEGAVVKGLVDDGGEDVPATGAAFDKWAEANPVEYVPCLDALRADAEAAGVRVDGRWGEARLREEIATARRGEGVEHASTGD